MDTPFKVIFRQPKFKSEDEVLYINNFVTDEKSLYKIPNTDIPVLVENVRLTLEFLCENSQSRLYMDGLDTLPTTTLGENIDDEAYILPTSGDVIILYDNVTDKNKYLETHLEGYYPFIPGYYRIRVLHDGVNYYARLKVMPKQVTEEQWVAMREEIEETLHGLAQDLIHRNATIDQNENLPIPVNLLRKLYIIKNDYYKWISALKAINENPRINIKKEYSLIPKGKAANIDANSIRYKVRHPESANYTYSPNNIRSYDLLENQWMKKILSFILKDVNELLDYMNMYKDKVKREISAELRFHDENHSQVRLKQRIIDEIKEYETFVKRVRGYCLPILKSEWMENINDEEPMYIPHALQLDQRYKRLHKLYRLLKGKEMSITLASQYDYYWKRTDLLYEIWGFLQLVKALQHELVGFKVTRGWIFNVIPSNQALQIPFLEPGTTIEFVKDDVKINLVYDETLPFKKEATKFEKPLFSTNNHNRPDARMDFYKDEDYLGSIIVDFKYRPIWHIWNNSKLEGYKQNHTMRQLISYGSNLTSPFTYNKKYPGLWRRLKTVHEVWAMYPSHPANWHTKSPFDSYQIRLMEVTPQQSQENLYTSLASAIKGVVNSEI
ncbi:DUF2357 domain-containing protein [Priestia megaterium]|uniref:DUF2357 domain-containing protein n=1 Tax=Priestia megaterium TaxID=1404 RepID=UPI002452DBDF|nr:DUF2357 domain-containing protein [Priestia megaterium]MDH3155922.1 DUF2357 domain-containing protein [Priestia megaterium]MED4116308.1 DUF2357 domain-containing protein [Priestia megaterium]